MFFLTIFKKGMLKMVHESINHDSGMSKLFNKKEIKNLKIHKSEDLYLLFLPNFFMDTPFHFMLLNDEHKLFNKIANSLEPEMFCKFKENTKLKNKLISMFDYIFHNVSYYSFDLTLYFYFYLTDGNYTLSIIKLNLL